MLNYDLDNVGRDWLVDAIGEMPDHVERVGPVQFNEDNRYLPDGVSPRPGYIRYDLFPFLTEIIDCFDPLSPVREVNVMKGVQVGFTTLLESILLYYIAHIKSAPAMFITADKELATGRIENNILPMINESEFDHLIRSHDVSNKRKTGKTKDQIQWDGGGFMIYQGAKNAAKMRQYSVPLMLKDELDGWPQIVGRDGNPDKLTDARLSAYWSVRKILRGSTPLLQPSMIHGAFKNGDQRVYRILCKNCNAPQALRMEHRDENGEVKGGFRWETEGDELIHESVRYECKECGQAHYEYDKERIFSADYGAHWHPTAKPKEPGIRSYHLPAFYSPYGFRPWYKNIADYLDGWDVDGNTITDLGKYQEFYNNVLGNPFTPRGDKLKFREASRHRRAVYQQGEIPNEYAKVNSGSRILMVLCTVDVHQSFLAVATWGITAGKRIYLIESIRIETDNQRETFEDLEYKKWADLSDIIENRQYTADDGTQYSIAVTLIDAGWANSTVIKFAGRYQSGVFPIVGRDRPSKNQKIKEFDSFVTQAGTMGYRIVVDYYKDNLSTSLHRRWYEEQGPQPEDHINLPVNTPDDHIKELTAEVRREEVQRDGKTKWVWHRPGNKRNELGDLLVYASAGVDIVAHNVCIEHFKLDQVDFDRFWEYLESEQLFFDEPEE